MPPYTQENESRFEPDEMFFSSTDRRGVILSGNTVFSRVAEYATEELVGKPHNVIRHPDMPKSVFRLFWSMILSDKPIAAYVKNRSRTGKYYWVLALAFPYREGFLSIRIKPGSKIFAQIPALYRDLVTIEATKGIDAAATALSTALTNLGFRDYSDFMLRALAEELQVRARSQPNATKARWKLLETTRLLEVVHGLEGHLDEACRSFHNEFSRLKTLSLNMMVNTGAYGAAGKPMAVTSENFSRWGAEIADVLAKFLEQQQGFSARSQETSLLVNIALMQSEMADFFRRTEPEVVEQARELDGLATGNLQIAAKSMGELGSSFRDFLVALRNLTENLLAMKIVRLNSRVEVAHLPEGGTSMTNIVSDISVFITEIESRAKKLSEIIREIEVAMREIPLR